MRILSLILFVGYFFTSCSVPAEAQTWITDYDAAMKIAEKEGKTVLINFTGSDWCGWCKKLDREVFDTEEFKAYAAENLVLLKLDFPRKKQLPAEEKKQNQMLLSKHGVRGFPTIMLLDSKEKVIQRTGYRRGGPQAYIDHLAVN